LKIDWKFPSGVFSGLAYITQAPKEFDFKPPYYLRVSSHGSIS